MDPLAPDEIEVICTQCSFPTVTEYADDGSIIGFREEVAPKTEEEALEAGWFDQGLGLLCPKCTATYLKDLAADEEAGAVTGAHTGLGLAIVDAANLAPEPDEEEEE